MKPPCPACAALTGAMILASAPCFAAAPNLDADHDGVPDQVEERLGMDPNRPDTFATILTHDVRQRSAPGAKPPDGYMPRLDVTSLGYATIARGRHAWRLECAAPFERKNAQVIIYLNTDNDEKTGRKDTGGGIDVMLVYREGFCQVRQIDPAGNSSYANAVRSAIVAGALYVCADIPIAQVEGRCVYDVRAITETVTPHRGADGTPWTHVQGPAVPDRAPPPCLLTDWKTQGLIITSGIQAIERAKADPSNTVIPMSSWKLDGFQQDIRSEYRASSVVRSGSPGRLTVSVPKPGPWHVGFVLYDDTGDDRLEVLVHGRRQAVLIADWNDNRQHLYTIDKAFDLKAGDAIVLETIRPGGRYRIETVMLLADKPRASPRRFEIAHPAVTIPYDSDGTRAEITWTTAWPTRGRVEYGPTPALGKSASEESDWNNHRVWLTGLKRASTVHYRIVCPRPGAPVAATEARTFTAKPPDPPLGSAVRERLPFAPTGTAKVPKGWPITGGVPMPRGALGSPRHVRLLDKGGSEIPLQVTVTSRWDDGSIRWLLLDFQTRAETYVLEYGREVLGTRPPFKPGLRVDTDERGVHVNTGVMQVTIPKDRFAPFASATCRGQALPNTADVGAVLVDAKGRALTTLGPPDSIDVELQGPLRAVVRVRGRFASKSGSLFRYDARLHVYAFKPFARLFFTFANDNTRDPFTEIDSLKLRLPLSRGQRQHEAAYDERAPRPVGRVACPPFGGVAVREFWQHWPKTLSAHEHGVEVGLCPKFDEGRVPASGIDRHRLYYYLQTGRYKLKAGVSKRHEMLVSLGPDDLVGDFAAQADAFENPPILAAPPSWYAETKVFGDIAGPRPVFLSTYDGVFSKGFDAYLAGRAKNREYGMLNFGDWWGERGINWGNIEYDTQHAFLLQWARTGRARYFRPGIQAANHHMDVDLIHYSAQPSRVGRVYAHCIGHTGDYYRTSPVEGKGSTRGALTVSHTWTEGFLDDYLLTGDRRALQAAELIANHYNSYGTVSYDFTNCRIPGWHLILSMAMYRATRDPYHLNACHIIMDRVLERQTPDGGWRRQMVPGHCHHLPRHHGNAGFMVAVLMTGMRWYHQETNDPRVLESIHRAARFLASDMWVEEAKGFRYTSCRGTSAGPWCNFMACDGICYAARLKRDAELARVARVGIKAAIASGISGFGKSISQATRVMPHVLYHLDELEKVLPGKDP